MTIDWDNCPSNTSFLEQPTDPENRELSENETAEDQIRKALEQAYTTDKLSKQTHFNAVCLRKLKDSDKSTGVIKVKARIPELHSLLPKPRSENDYATMSLYPTFIGLKTSFSTQTSERSDSILPGTVLLVTFGNMSNFGQPRLLEIGNILGSNARGKDSGAGVYTDRGASTEKYSGADLIKISEELKGNKRINFRPSGRSWGTEAMKNFLQDVSKVNVAADDIWYVQDISLQYGETIINKNPTTGELKKGHESHQSGVDVDITIPVKEFEIQGEKIGQSIKFPSKSKYKGNPGKPRKQWRWHFADVQVDKPSKRLYLDVNANIALLCVCAHHEVKKCLVDKDVIKKIRSTIKGSTNSDRGHWLIKHILKEEYFSNGLLGELEATPAATAGAGGTAMGPAALYFAEKIFDRKWLYHVRGHKEHYHIRVKGEGFNDKDGNGQQDQGRNDPATVGGVEVPETL